MPAAPPIERYQPSFLRFPIQNNKTGFQPVHLPVILVVPARRTPEGLALADAEILELKFFIADAPEQSLVAGPFNTQLLVPTLERYVIYISSLQLSEVSIDPKIRQFYDVNGNAIEYEDAVEGDSFEYTQIRGSITSKIIYYPDADYYDLSLFEIDVEDLPMPNWYNFVWQASYHPRVVFDDFVSSTAGGYCINQGATSISQFRQLIGHPGDVHHEMFRKTPPFFFDNQNSITKLQNDPLLAFYRPFADMLQDIFDEQAFLNGINHVDTIPAQLIPYLAYLIGWDLPNYPGVTDTVRRSILRQAVMLQQLKGSRRAIVELFDIFGYSIELLNVWYSTDGTRFVAPDEKLPDILSNNEITTTTVCQIEPLVTDYGTAGFGSINVPLMYKTTGDITVTAWLVKPGTTKDAIDAAIEDLNSDPDVLTSICIRSPNGSYLPKGLLDRLPVSDPNMVSMTELVVNRYTGEVVDSVSSSTTPILSSVSTKFDNIKNILTIIFDHYIDFSDGSTLYIFATYPRTEINIPDDMVNLRSNRFDVNILLKDGQVPSSQVLDFLLNFIFKLKAFHSLLRKIRFTINNVIAYNVQDYCSDAAGNLQVPPAIIPIDASADKCDDNSKTMGFKEEDLTLRKLIYQSLLEEHAAWRDLDGTHISDPALEHYLNVPVTRPRGTECQFTNVGQDRVFGESTVDLDHHNDIREIFCQDEKTTRVNCFTGRVKDEIKVTPILPLCEVVRCKPCYLGSGFGTYYVMPIPLPAQSLPGFGQYPGQVSGHLSKLYRNYNHPTPVSLHYTNRQYMAAEEFELNGFLALERPSLGIQKDNFGFPGHRFLNQANLENDFTTEWKAKPWDYPCGDNPLNAEIIIGTDGEEHLIFDDQVLTYKGNGLPQDISSFGTHIDRAYQVTHKIYIKAQPGHPSVTLDSSVVETSDESIAFDSSVPFDPLFKTYNRVCNKDYIDGYPATYGRFDYDVVNIVDGREFLEPVYAALGLPSSSLGSGSSPLDFLFTYGSQILLAEDDTDWQYYIPYRYDCGCSAFPCDTGDTSISDVTSGEVAVDRCSLDFFRMSNGQYDFNCDKLELDIKLILEEKVGMCGIPYDGSIPNGISILVDEECPEDLPVTGSYRYKDEYETIHEGSWVLSNSVLDLTVMIKQPYIWGQEPEGYIKNKILYRKGIITVTHYVYKQVGDVWELQAQGSEQYVDFIQMNPGCGDTQFVDNFCYHFYCNIVDNVDSTVVCGSRWTDVDDLQVEWPSLSVDSFGVVDGYTVPDGIQPFLWVDVWGNNDSLVHVCPSGTSGATA